MCRIQVIDRRGHLCRFKLRGALADDFLEQVCGDGQQQPQQQTGDVPESDFEADSDHEDGFQSSEIAQQCAGTNLALLMKRLSAKKKESKKSKKSAAEPSSASPPVEASLYSVVVVDPRVRLHRQHLTSKSTRTSGLNALSLLREPTQEDLASTSDDIQCPVSSEPLTKAGNNDAEEPESELILQKLSAILRWTRTPSAAASASEALAKYPFTSPLDKKQSSVGHRDVVLDEDSRATLVPYSYLWSHSKRQQLSKAFQKDHIVNGKCFQARQDRSQRLMQASTKGNSTAMSDGVHLIAIEKCGPFPSTSGWDLILLPSFAPSLMKSFVYAGALVVGLDEDEALDTVLERPR